MNAERASLLTPTNPFEELRQLFWTLNVQAQCGMNFAELGDIDGLDHILGCLNASFRRAAALRQEISDDRRP
jgi:hypothetical protein